MSGTPYHVTRRAVSGHVTVLAGRITASGDLRQQLSTHRRQSFGSPCLVLGDRTHYFGLETLTTGQVLCRVTDWLPAAFFYHYL